VGQVVRSRITQALKHISTSYAEAPEPHRADVDPQVHARLTNAFSKWIENHAAAVALFRRSRLRPLGPSKRGRRASAECGYFSSFVT
jgi:hypothetical protein